MTKLKSETTKPTSALAKVTKAATSGHLEQPPTSSSSSSSSASASSGRRLRTARRRYGSNSPTAPWQWPRNRGREVLADFAEVDRQSGFTAGAAASI